MSKPTAPSPLAKQIYALLLRTVRARRGSVVGGDSPSITYGDLATELRAAGFPSMYPRNSVMHAALGEVTQACHAARLPCLPAIVWRLDTSRPGDSYFTVAHPSAKTVEARLTAWKREHDRVVEAVARYPRTLGGTAAER